LVFRDLDRLKHIAATGGRIQIIYAGKAHPQDQGGKELIHRIFQARDALKTHVKIAYMVNYDWPLAQLMTSGVDVWLNTPEPPLEASGTSGMKAALNGVPSLSILDGWWIEGCIEGVTGWAIGGLPKPGDGDADRAPRDAASLYDKLERVVVPLFYRDRERFIDVMRHAIALNGSFFNTQRMVLEYVTKAYFR
jgi:starch phosphorylase